MKMFVKVLLLPMLVLPILFGMMDRTHAEENTVMFTLHKIVFPENKMPEPSQNDGDERLKKYDGLNGVTFDVYDVTEDFYQLLEGSEGKSAKDVQADLQGMNLSERKSINQQITSTVDTEEGIAQFTLPRVSNDKDAVYLFRESAAPGDVKSKATDMIVALPVVDLTGEPLEEPVHLYPKNEIIQQPFEKEIVDQQPSYQFGDQISYTLTTKLPSSLSIYSKYLISDQADESLVLDAKSLKVQIAGETYVGYQAETTEHSFKLNFDLEKLKSYAGKDVTISYTMTLSDKDKIDKEIINRAELETDFDKIPRERKFKTGGKKFIKVDDVNKDQALSEAEFVVKNQQAEYLHEDGKGYKWKKNKDGADLVKLTSNKEGIFEIKGLRYGNYSLEEIKPPVGYILSKKDIQFEVSENSYAFSEGILHVVNQKDSSTKQPNEPTPIKKQSVFKDLPKMNDLKNPWIAIIGGLLLITAAITMAVRSRKNRRSE